MIDDKPAMIAPKEMNTTDEMMVGDGHGFFRMTTDNRSVTRGPHLLIVPYMGIFIALRATKDVTEVEA